MGKTIREVDTKKVALLKKEAKEIKEIADGWLDKELSKKTDREIEEIVKEVALRSKNRSNTE